MRCSQCGTENKDSSKFCASCGEALQLACLHCGTPFQRGQSFCSECGVSVVLRCAQCGVENAPKRQFCSHCGSGLQAICPACGNQNTKESHFCGHCAYPLLTACHACGYANLPGQTFCGNCQKQLREDLQIAPAAERLEAITAATAAQRKEVPERSCAPTVPPPPMSENQADWEETPSEPVVSASEAPAEVQALEEVVPIPLWRETTSETTIIEPPLPIPPEPEITFSPEESQASALGEETQFQEYPELETFALASVELVNMAHLVAAVQDREHVADFRQGCISFLEAQASAVGGMVESVHAHVLFLAFRRYATLEESVVAATQWALEMLQETFELQGHPLKIRIGIDLERIDQRNPLASTTERSIASPGTLVVSERVVPFLEGDSHLEQIGPLRIGSQMVTLYQVVPPPAVEPLESAIDFEQDAPEVADLPLAEDLPHEAEALPSDVPLPDSLSPKEPLPVGYAPPQYGAYRGLRAPNVTYEQAYEALLSELKGFLDTGLEGKGKVLSLCASEGLGKSSIIRMALAQMNPDPSQINAFWLVAHHYRALEKEPIPLAFWLEWLQSPFGLVMEGAPQEDARQVVSQALSYLYAGQAPEDVQTFMEDLLSIRPLEPITIQSRENLGRLEHGMGNFIATLASQKPVVLVIEDVHYADPASMDLLVRLIQRGILEYPVFILLSQPRNYYPEGVLSQYLQAVPYKEFVVSDLNHEEARKFLQEGPLYGTFDQFPAPLLDALIHQSKGLPLYLSEALRMLHLQGVLELQKVMVGAVETEKFVVAPAYAQATQLPALPHSVEAMALERLRYLSDKTRYVLQLASVLGEKFPFGVLHQLCGDIESMEFQGILKDLYDHGWMVPDPVNTGRFAHGILWQAVYESISPALREQLHQLVSEYLEKAFNQGYAINPALIAYHASRGGLTNRAFQYWNLAGVYATQVGSLLGVNLSLFRALGLLGQVHSDAASEWEVQIQENLGILNIEENPDLSLRLLEKVAYYWEKQGNMAKRIEVLGFLASCREAVGRYHEALGYLEKALVLLPKAQYPLEYATMLTHQLEYLYTLGKVQRAADLLTEEIEPLCTQREWEKGSAYFNAYINSRLIKARILLMQCDPKAFEVVEEAVGFAKEQDLVSLDIGLKLVRSQGLLWRGSYHSCQRSLQGVLEQIEALDTPERFLSHWGLWAMACHAELGDWENASLLIPNTLYQSEQANDYPTWMMATAYAGAIAMGLGNLEEAKATLEKALTLSSEYRFATPSLLAWRYLAETELRLGAQGVAEEIATRALAVAQKPDIQNRHEVFLLTNLRAKCLLVRGEVKEAGKILEASWPEVIQTGFSPLIAQTAAEIGALYAAMAIPALKPEQRQKYLDQSQAFYGKAKGIWKDLGNTYQAQQLDLDMTATTP